MQGFVKNPRYLTVDYVLYLSTNEKQQKFRIKVDELNYELPMSPFTVALDTKYPLEGQFEGVTEGHLFGWAIDSSEPFNSIDVVVYYNQRIICKGIADLKREDLENKLGNNIHHGFKIKLPNQYYDGKSRRFRVVFSSTGNPLEGSPQTISFS